MNPNSRRVQSCITLYSNTIDCSIDQIDSIGTALQKQLCLSIISTLVCVKEQS